ncbi:SepZ protein [Sulfolobus sp. E11-6]|nr:SepZ protein [Sulfolobus sp. E11-6]
MAGVRLIRRVLGAIVIAIGIGLWITDLFLVKGLPYSQFENETLVAIVPAAGAVLVAGGTLIGLWG